MVRQRGGRKRVLGTRALVTVQTSALEPRLRIGRLVCERRLRILAVVDDSSPGVLGGVGGHVTV